MKCKGFYGEKIELVAIKEPYSLPHDNVEIRVEGKTICYLHLRKDGLTVFAHRSGGGGGKLSATMIGADMLAITIDETG